MSTEKIEYNNLAELSSSGYHITDGQADIAGWRVVDESGVKVGKVKDLLFDLTQNTIRYVIVDLDESALGTVDKAILIPIGVVNLADEGNEVIIPAMHEEQYQAMPNYVSGEVTRATETQIRVVMGSPAALRIEEELEEIEHTDFYEHHHFDRGNLVSERNKNLAGHDASPIASSGLADETKTIHSFIENSPYHHETANVGTESHAGAMDKFSVIFDRKTLTVEPLDNGIYRVFDGEEKIGVLYAEAGEQGVQWETMDSLDQRLVTLLGKAITSHNS